MNRQHELERKEKKKKRGSEFAAVALVATHVNGIAYQ